MVRQNKKSNERKVDEIIITNRVLRLGSLVIPINNVAQIEVHKISKKSGRRFLYALLIGALVSFLGLASGMFRHSEVVVIAAGVVSMILSFILLKIFQKRQYALRIQSSTGQEDFVTSKMGPF